jgi:hypothetical protein
MIELGNDRAKNGEHFSRLLAFCREVTAVCDELNIAPLLTGSLAVFAYTRRRMIGVNDIDLACSESEFPRLCRALAARGIACEVKAWSVLQARRDDLKVEFDSTEHWLADAPTASEALIIDGYVLDIVGLSSLRELYRRGLEAVARQPNEVDRGKVAAIAEKYALLCSM